MDSKSKLFKQDFAQYTFKCRFQAKNSRMKIGLKKMSNEMWLSGKDPFNEKKTLRWRPSKQIWISGEDSPMKCDSQAKTLQWNVTLRWRLLQWFLTVRWRLSKEIWISGEDSPMNSDSQWRPPNDMWLSGGSCQVKYHKKSQVNVCFLALFGCFWKHFALKVFKLFLG